MATNADHWVSLKNLQQYHQQISDKIDTKADEIVENARIITISQVEAVVASACSDLISEFGGTVPSDPIEVVDKTTTEEIERIVSLSVGELILELGGTVPED